MRYVNSRYQIIFFSIFASVCLYGCTNNTNNTNDLKKQIEVLNKRIETLEAAMSSSPRRLPVPVYFRDEWDPFYEMQKMQEEVNSVFDRRRGSLEHSAVFSAPQLVFHESINFIENEKEYTIVVDMKGLDENKIKVKTEAHSISISGEFSKTESKEDQNQQFKSQQYGSFFRVIPLPENADTSKITKNKKGDQFVIEIPKK